MSGHTSERFPSELGERSHRVIGEFARIGQGLSEFERSDLISCRCGKNLDSISTAFAARSETP